MKNIETILQQRRVYTVAKRMWARYKRKQAEIEAARNNLILPDEPVPESAKVFYLFRSKIFP